MINVLTSTPGDYTDGAGRLWKYKGPAVFAKVSEVVDTPITVSEERQDVGDDWRSLSDTELALRLRPRLLAGNYEYELAAPDMALVAAIRKMTEVPITDPVSTPAPVVETAGTSLKPSYIMGSDDRVVQNPGDVRHMMKKPGGCSATMISRSNAISAAHCFYGSGGWKAYSSMQPGSPGQMSAIPIAAIIIPGAFNDIDNVTTEVPDHDWDFAIVAFSTQVGNTTGWLGTTSSSAVGVPPLTRWARGYSGDKPLGTQWLRYGGFWGERRSRWRHDLDIVRGDSGAGLYDDNLRVSAVQSTEWKSGTNEWNEARKWDATTYNFFATYGSFP